jgi:hypothetical protein
MSIDIAIAWAKKTIRSPGAIEDAVGMFQQAARDGEQATLLLSGALTRDRKGWIVRWTGREFVAAELSPASQAGLGMIDGAICRQFEKPVDNECSHARCSMLDKIQIDDACIRSDAPIAGRCTVVVDEASPAPGRNCALRCEFYRPDLRRPVTGYWNIDAPLLPGPQELNFRFSPLESAKNPGAITGTLVLFLQMVSAERWTPPVTGLREISNTAVALIELRR